MATTALASASAVRFWAYMSGLSHSATQAEQSIRLDLGPLVLRASMVNHHRHRMAR